jgi:hypothetical protein
VQVWLITLNSHFSAFSIVPNWFSRPVVSLPQKIYSGLVVEARRHFWAFLSRFAQKTFNQAIF